MTAAAAAAPCLDFYRPTTTVLRLTLALLTAGCLIVPAIASQSNVEWGRKSGSPYVVDSRNDNDDEWQSLLAKLANRQKISPSVDSAPTHDLVWPEIERSSDSDRTLQRVRLMFEDDDDNRPPMVIELEPTVEDTGFGVVDNDRTSSMAKRRCHYQLRNQTLTERSVDGTPAIVAAAISNCDGQLRGVIVTDLDILVLHPLPPPKRRRKRRDIVARQFRSSRLSAHALIKRQSATNGEQNDRNFCGISTDRPVLTKRDAAADPGPTSRRIANEKDLTVEMAIYIDNELWRKYYSEFGGAADSKLQDFVTTVVNNIQILYNHPTMTYRMTFKVVRYEVWKSQPQALTGDKHRDGDAQSYLDAFCTYQYKLTNRDWDQTLLLTGYDLHRNNGRDKTISGIARIYGACDPYNSCVLVEGHDFSSVFIASHEMGHGFGMRHDEPYCSSSYIMSGSLGPGKVTWSTCSVNELAKYIDKLDNNGKNCMRVSNANSAVLQLDQGTLPGQKYSADMQCAMMHGKGYQRVIPKTDYAGGPCAMMWCGQNSYGRIITSHPALEGTFCGDSRYCLKGQCSGWGGGVAAPAPAPKAQNGGWSDWNQPSCASCVCAPVQGGIGVVQARRTCTNPSPANGGTDCAGSDVRGLVCNSNCPAQTETVDGYIRRQCAWRRSLGNSELTGDGAQLLRDESRACKVFCDVSGSNGVRNYRFYGDLLPDGAACGSGKYCTGGRCLTLSCENGALIDQSVDCPAATQRCNVAAATSLSNVAASAPAPPPVQPMVSVLKSAATSGDTATWGVWGEWSSACYSGVRVRLRNCYGTGQCGGSQFTMDKEQRPC